LYPEAPKYSLVRAKSPIVFQIKIIIKPGICAIPAESRSALQVPKGNEMARSRRALLRKGNVTNIADARKKREEKEQSAQQALANARLSTLEEVSATQHQNRLQGDEELPVDSASEPASASSTDSRTELTGSNNVRESVGMSRMSGQFSGFDLSDVDSYTATDPVPRSPQGSTPQRPAASDGTAGNGSTDDTAQRDTATAKVSNRTFNREKVNALKKAIANGTYQINPHRIADKFIEREAPA